MALDIHPKARAQLLTALGEHLPGLSVNFGMFLNRLSFSEIFLDQRILPQSGPLHDKLRKYVSEAPLVDFVNGVLSRELFDMGAYKPKAGPEPLSELPDYADAVGLAHRLLSEFESLPWQYTLTMALPREFSDVFCKHIANMQLSDHVSVHSGQAFLTNTIHWNPESRNEINRLLVAASWVYLAAKKQHGIPGSPTYRCEQKASLASMWIRIHCSKRSR